MPLTRASAGTMLAAIAIASAACAPRAGAPDLTQATGRVSMAGPAGLARSGSTLYVVDLGGRALRRLDLRSGRLSTVATSAPLENPFDVSVEPDGGLALVDGGRVVRLSPDGHLRVLASWEEIRDAIDGSGLVTAVASAPAGVVVAAQGYVARIDRASRAITPVVRSDGSSAFNDIVADGDGHLYVAESGAFAGNHRIRRVDGVTGAVTSLVGPTTPVAAASAAHRSRVKDPANLALDERGGLVFSDASRILRLDLGTGELRLLSTSQSAEGGWASLAVAADGALLVADYVANRIRRIDTASGRIRAIAGGGGPIAVIGHGSGGGYPDPPNETCTDDPSAARVQVTVAAEAGAMVPGAIIRLIPEAEGAPFTAISNADGKVTLAAPSGDYVVLATLPGFLPKSLAVRLSAGCTATVALKLPLGGLGDER